MTDIQNLKRLAEELSTPRGNMAVDGDWMAKRLKLQAEYKIAANPSTILALIQRIEEYEWLKKAMRDGSSRWYAPDINDSDISDQIAAAIAAQSTKEQG